MLYILVLFALLIVIPAAVLFVLSPGKPAHLSDKTGAPLKNSISEKLFLNINGTRQGMFIKSKNSDNPVLLYLHGGMPDYFFTEKYPTHLEDNFTMIWWEQRNCGISYDPETAEDAASLEQLVDDTIVLTKYLLERFKKDKIFLMGHSGGTFPGVYVIDKMPELYAAYIGVAQMSDQVSSERIAFEFILKQSEETGNKKLAERLKNFSYNDDNKIPEGYLKIRDTAMHKLGIGTMRNIRNIITGLFLPSLCFSEYTLKEKYHLWAGKSRSGISQNWEEMTHTNLIETKNNFKVPVYFFHGLYDYTCSYELAKKYFNALTAPVKGFYTFRQSAHSPLFEEPEKMNLILTSDVINFQTHLADKSKY